MGIRNGSVIANRLIERSFTADGGVSIEERFGKFPASFLRSVVMASDSRPRSSSVSSEGLFEQRLTLKSSVAT
jgi:hypothetical protein